ncbi:Uncharacterized protein conserved in bacteria [Mesomycoplasma dispar]|uniref:CRISPR-associated endonuclease Cas9 n=1 Tax=Mesomycoplasma dispar TaxID=86660 RepID=A0AAJ5NPU3_9BACT|nr:type II CRISPR RNA-guided endonuclease Cas9 [Mesomycoplasma dispar]AJR12511.1 hypothetical protein MDIS_00430 [Mesomycoplasma dispar]VEU61242.1 Uncharacterized protein conserved in bacteria [Mesomycoplasma dispar]
MGKKHITIGFDLGIASVGWAIIESDTSKILNWGSRLFEERKTAQKRRGHRSTRRNIRRKAYRNQKFMNLILKYKELFGLENTSQISRIDKKDVENYKKIEEKFTEIYRNCANKYPNILDLKIKALNSKIEKLELVWILHDYLENRGFFYDIEQNSEEEKKKNKKFASKYKGSEFPSILLDRFFKKNGFFNSYGLVSEYGYNFSNLHWRNEISKLFEIQEIDYEFGKKFLDIFSSVRDYAKGPGSKNSISKYGVFEIDETGKVVEYENIWDKTIGKCSFFVQESRVSSNYPSYEIFNLLNQLINLSSELKLENGKNWQLKTKDRDFLLDKLLEARKNKKNKDASIEDDIIKIILADFGLEKTDITNDDSIQGRDIIKAKPTTKLETTNKLLKIIYSHSSNAKQVKSNNLVEFLPFLDKICAIVDHDKAREKNEVLKKLEEKGIFSKFQIIPEKQEKFLDSLFKEKLNFKKIGNLSLKAIHFFLPKMISQNKNSEFLKWNDLETRQTWEEEKNKIKKVNKKSKYLNPRIFEDEIISPGTKNTFEQAILVLNQIIKKYSKDYQIDAIIIESPRTKNDKKTTYKINKAIKESKEKDKKLFEALNLKEEGYTFEQLKSKSKSLFDKLRLYYQQEKLDLYDLDSSDEGEIKINDLIEKSQNYEIDHIIPYSMSYDNSQANKILTLRAKNGEKRKEIASKYARKKGEEYFKKYLEKVKELFIDSIKSKNNTDYVDLDKDSSKKKYRLLTLEDFDQYHAEFIARNLNDTRYSTKLFYHALRDHFQNNEHFEYLDEKSQIHKVKVATIKGHVTRYFRGKTGYSKDEIFENNAKEDESTHKKVIKKRRENNEHHAVDAAIVAIIGNENRQLANLLTISDNSFENYDEDHKLNVRTGEIVRKPKFEIEKFAKIDELKNKILEQCTIAKNEIPIKFSRKLRTILNCQISNENLCGFKFDENQNKYFKINKINLLNSTNEELEKYFINPFGTEESKYKVLMAESHKVEFERLKEIFFKYKEKGDAFAKYIDDLKKKEPELIDEIDAAKAIGKILYYKLEPLNQQTFYGEPKIVKKYYKNIRIIKYDSIPIQFKMLSKHDGGKSYKDDLRSLYSLVYKVYEKGKETYKSIPVNSALTKFGSNNNDLLDENNYNSQNLLLYKNDFTKPIPTGCKPIIAIKKGVILKKKNYEIQDDFTETEENGRYFFISGISKECGKNIDTRFTLRFIEISKDTVASKRVTDKIFKHYDLIHLDELGNEYPIKIKEHTEEEKKLCTIK